MKIIFFLLFSLITIAQIKDKPNVIVIFLDDLGYQDLGCYGSPDISTPRIDELATEGMRFTDFYSASPVCSASRASLLTGRYPQKVGVHGVLSPSAKQGLNQNYKTIPKMLKSLGYATAAVGKWHLGDQASFMPTQNGFDSYFGIPYSNDMYPSRNTKYALNCNFREGYSLTSIKNIFESMGQSEKQPTSEKNKVPLIRNLECIEFPTDQTTITRRYTDESLDFINECASQKKPFFLYLAHSMPHTPLFSSEDFQGKSERGLYGDVVQEIDYNVGRILDRLKELKIDNNTIVMFSSDNGPWLSKAKDGGSAAPFFEGKFTCFEGGLRVPFIVKWPKLIEANSTCNQISSTIDVLPTLATVLGASVSKDKIDGKNIIDYWAGNKTVQSKHKYFFMVYNGQAVRSGQWKYHKNQFYTVTKNSRTDTGPALYNLTEDPSETVNLIKKFPEIASKLSAVLDEHISYIKK